MRGFLSLVVALLFPVVLLVWLFLLSYLEDTLPRDMRSARRTPDPPPILRLPVRVHTERSPLLVAAPARPQPVVPPQPVGVELQPVAQDRAAVGDVLAKIPQQRVPDETVRAATG